LKAGKGTETVSSLRCTPFGERAGDILYPWLYQLPVACVESQPLPWRFHLVHHTDPDLDVTTALRFHFGERSVLFFTGVR